MAISDKLPKHINELSIEESVGLHIAGMKRDGGLARLLSVINEAKSMLESPSPDMRPRVEQMMEEVSKAVAPHTPCKKGCSSCCYMAVAITSREAGVISKAYGIPMEKALPVYDQARLVKKYVACKCPFLEHGSCQIYEHRPSACRGFFNLSSFPELCDVITYPGSDVPSVDLTPFWVLTSTVAAMSGESAADIRDFFPEGLHPTQTL